MGGKKAALLKVVPGQTTLDSFVVKKKKRFDIDTVAQNCIRTSEEEPYDILMLDDEESL